MWYVDGCAHRLLQRPGVIFLFEKKCVVGLADGQQEKEDEGQVEGLTATGPGVPSELTNASDSVRQEP